MSSHSCESDSEPASDDELPPSGPKVDIKTRYIYRYWPRDPKGPVIQPSTLRGKETSNGLDLWGETLHDFYNTQRIPGLENLRTITTGSRMAAWTRQVNELDHAADEIHWAEHVEKSPVEVPPCDIAELIRCSETRVHMGIQGKSMRREALNSSMDESTQSLKSVFDASRQPPPWPIVPFSKLYNPLQQRIPMHLLPQKLIVHDPWNLLTIKDCDEDGDTEWTEKTDRVRTYRLQFSEETEKKIEEQRKADAERANRPVLGDSFIILPSDMSVGKFTLTSKPVLVQLPPPPPPPPSTPEAHLYISPAHRAGVGNHSYVYNAEWELPRSMFVKNELCRVCIREDVEKILEKGGGETVMTRTGPDAGTREGGSASTTSVVGELTVTEEIIPGVVAEKVHHRDLVAAEKNDGIGENCGKGKGKEKAREKDIHVIKPATTLRTATYVGPVQRVEPDTKWQNPERAPYCEHLRIGAHGVPLTCKLRVAAKLSIEHDTHLAREAKNYQSFPSHLFEHWNGFNVIPPLHDPVPVGAVVPQFYGYYIPEDTVDATNASDSGKNNPSYLSPILLLEDCGVPVDPDQLGIDDSQECASLYYRFHHAGWVHESVAARNILTQSGPLAEYPISRGSRASFRLIDFGRSYDAGESLGRIRAAEEMTVAKLFNVHIFERRPFVHADILP